MNVLGNTGARHLLATASAAALMVLSCGLARAEVFLYNVSVPTDQLNANIANGPFSMLFEFSDGSGTGDSDNTVTLTGFNTGPASPVTLTDNEPLVYDVEGFTPTSSPGSVLSFDLSTTNNTDLGGTPDEFSFFILDGTSTPLMTTDELSSSLFTIDLGGDSPTVTTFETIEGYTGIDPSITPYAAVPEPSPLAPIWVGAMTACGLIIMRRRRCGTGGGK